MLQNCSQVKYKFYSSIDELRAVGLKSEFKTDTKFVTSVNILQLKNSLSSEGS